MITFQAFLDKYDGKYIDYDGKFGYQCVDLMRAYMAEVLGMKPYDVLPGAPGAKDIYNRYTGATPFTKIANGKVNYPHNGDIVFWGFYPFVTGINGHVGICVGDGASMWNFITFDQNYPTRTSCHRQLHNYRGVMGWLRKT